LAYRSTKLLFSYLFPYKVKFFREAVFSGNLEKIRQLAGERKVFLTDAVDADGWTALGLAVLTGQPEVLKLLLELGCNPNVANGFDGDHPLVVLARTRLEDSSKTPLIADILLDAGSDPLAEVRYQADTATRADATQTPSFHETPLLCSIRFQNIELLKKFIEHRVDINTLNPETGTSALMLASALGYNNICNLLIDNGAQVNASDFGGNTPLHLAVQGYGERVPVVQTLLQRGANPNAPNEGGFTPIMIAKQMDNQACYQLLTSQTIPLSEPPVYHEVVPPKEQPNDQKVFSFYVN